MAEKPEKERDDVLRRMLKTPPVRRKPKPEERRAPETAEELAEQVEKNPNLLDDLARELGQDVEDR